METCCTQARRRPFAAIALALLSVTVGVSESNAQWTQWGGPGRNFSAASTGLAKSWPTEGPRKIWSRDLGEGYSAILVDHGKLFTMYRRDDQEIVVSLDAATGKSLWEYAYDSSPKKGHIDEFGRGPRATPLIVGNHIYTIGVAAKMHCLDKSTGKVVWEHDLWDEFKGNVQGHGYSSSPVAYKNTVIALVGGKGASIVAFDQKTGDVAWKALDFKNSFSSPRIFKVHGEDQLVTFMAGEAIGVDPNNGNLKWRYAIKNQWNQNVCMPVMADENHLFLSTNLVGARGLKLTPDGDKTKVEELWSTRKVQFYHVTSVEDGGYVYGSSGGRGPSFVSAVNIKTGKIAWRQRGFSKANCIKADGRLIILDEDGVLALATATPEELTVHSKVELLDNPAWTVPTLVGKTLYVRDKKTVTALDLG